MARGAAPAPLFSASMLVAVVVKALLISMSPWNALLKAASSRGNGTRLVLAGSICAGAFLLFLYGLSRSGPGLTISLRNTSIFFAQLFAWRMGERMTRLQWLGVALSAAGASLLTL